MKHLIIFMLLIQAAVFTQELHITKIIPPDRKMNTNFGEAIGYENGLLVVGCPYDNKYGTQSGSVYLYEIDNISVNYKRKFFTWNIQQKDMLGRFINFEKGKLFFRVAGDPFAWFPSGDVHYFDVLDNQLDYQHIIRCPFPFNNEWFGKTIHNLKDRYIVSAEGSRDTSSSYYSVTGSFYIYSFNQDSLQLPQRYMGEARGELQTGLGSGFVSNDSLLFVAASGESDEQYRFRGCVYVYNILHDTLIFREKVCSPMEQSGQRFGRSMALSGNRLFIAAPQGDFAYDQGRVYVYDISGDSLKLTHTITAPNSSNINFFGLHLAALGDTLLVGAPQDSSFGWNRGGIYLFQFDESNNYRLERRISLPDSADVLQFPSSVILTKDFILAGASYDDQMRGAVYMFSMDKPVGVEETSPPKMNWELGDNYPNPFNNQTKIRYQTVLPGRVRLLIYDILGRELKVLKDEYHQAGIYEMEFTGDDMPSGIYFYTLETSGTRIVKKMVLMK